MISVRDSRKAYPEDFDLWIEPWYKSRGMTPPDRGFFGKVGFIVPDIAAGFLMQTDTEIAILEPFIANPVATRHERNQALYEIMTKLIVAAKGLGYTKVFGFASSRPMINRALQLGFNTVESSTTVMKDVK